MTAFSVSVGRTSSLVALAVCGALFNAFSLPGCVQGPAEKVDSTDAAISATPAGVYCGKDPTSGVELCLGTNQCPDVGVDSNELPGCGLRSFSGSFDLECVCNGTELCPIGVAKSCDEIPSLLGQRTLAEICSQAGTGACKEIHTPSTGAAGKPSTTVSTCDRNCSAECAGSPACLQACGC